ncbi:unnamed protein product [Albugo candida]|uniref:EGF-like domain-containing protein n=1 Tax=Albugo candida TaxID=65357 RepID=A0A024GES9_9STRA|nr:unnamed protein product [Albugo candida]|eukprot:CCI45020.1 unnamed protein product [Albugo candida]
MEADEVKAVQVFIPAALNRPTHTLYNIFTLVQPVEQEWMVNRRYSQFLQLRRDLCACLSKYQKCPRCPIVLTQILKFSFPHRTLFRTNRVVRKRVKVLQKFLHLLIDLIYLDDTPQCVTCSQSIRNVIRPFLIRGAQPVGSSELTVIQSALSLQSYKVAPRSEKSKGVAPPNFEASFSSTIESDDSDQKVDRWDSLREEEKAGFLRSRNYGDERCYDPALPLEEAMKEVVLAEGLPCTKEDVVARLIDGQVAAPIIVRGNKLYNAKTKERFVIVGMTYEYAVSDTYYTKYSKEVLRTKLAGLKYNTLRLYDVNPEESYDKFMKDMAEINVYVIISVSPDNNPYYGKYRYSTIDRTLPANGKDMTKTCYPALLLEYGKKIIKKFAVHDNLLAILVGNEILQVNLKAAACVKQYAADLKNWMRVNGKKIRLIPLAYAAADSSYGDIIEDADKYHLLKIQGLLCGDRMSNGMMVKSIDIYLINEYRFCPSSTFAEAYERFLTLAKGIPIVIAFGEYGCKLSKGEPRTWEMISYLYDPPSKTKGFSEVFSGGLAYSYGEAKLSSASLFPMFTGGSSEITGKPSDKPSKDFYNLKQALSKHEPFPDKAEWTSNTICKWVPPLKYKIDPKSSIASTGFILPNCNSQQLTPKKGETWVTQSREGAICTDKGAPCDVAIHGKVGTTQESICGEYEIESGGGTCSSSNDCGSNGQCVINKGVGTCHCLACYTGADCSIKDSSSCLELTSSPNAPKFIFMGVGVFLIVMLFIFMALGILAKKKASVLSELRSEMKSRGFAHKPSAVM